jgi:hypothetical protein
VLFTARPVDAIQAHEWGLLDELINDLFSNRCDVGQSRCNPVSHRVIELANAITVNNSLMVQCYKCAIVKGRNVYHQMGLQRELELGLAHYMELLGDGQTFEGAKEYIADDGRPRLLESKL